MGLHLMLLADHLLEGRTIDIFHYQKVLAPLFIEVEDGYGIRVSQGSSGPSLAAKTLNRAQVVFIQGPQDLNGDYALHAMIPGFVDTGHTTSGDMFAFFF